MQNIIAAFDDAENAQRAYSQLRAAGVPADQLHLQLAPGQEFLAHAGPSEPEPGHKDHHPGVLASVGAFFANLFESHTDESGIYSDALRPGSSLLAVRALDHAQARNAAAILRDCGASHVDDRVGEAQEGGASRGPGSAGGSHMRPVAGGGSATEVGPVGTHSFTGNSADVGMPVDTRAVRAERETGPDRGS